MSRAHKGFTLVELMVTLAVTAIVLGIAIPSFNTQILNNRSIALGEDLATALNFARSEAVKGSKRVSVCVSSDGATCTGGDWKDGFIIFEDYAASDTAPNPVLQNGVDKPLKIFKVWKKQDANSEITAKLDADGDGEADGAAIDLIRFTSLGTLGRINNAPIVITSQLKNCEGESARKLVVGLSGMVSVARSTCEAPSS